MFVETAPDREAAGLAADDRPPPLPSVVPVVVPPPLPSVAANTPRRRGLLRRVAGWLYRTAEAMFGLGALWIGLAVLAALPLFQFLAFGYMLEVMGRMARGEWRRCFPGLRRAARLGVGLVGAVLVVLPFYLVDDLRIDAELIDPASPQTENLKTAAFALFVVGGAHLTLAVARGGRLLYFLWPFSNLHWAWRTVRQGRVFQEVRERFRDVVAGARGLRLGYYFSLGFRGFLGTLAWLAIPSALLAIGRGRPIVGFVAVVLTAIVALFLPFLQARFAAENRWRAMFDRKAAVDRIRRAPLANLLAVLGTLVLAIPLYLLKVEEVPRDAVWMLALVFVATALPLKIVTGWAYRLADRRDR
ncbi:MAG: hypothetical protein ACRC1K_11815, partial [Planctomycetia bacterium]